MKNRKLKILWLDVNSSYSHSSLALPLLYSASNYYGIEAEWFAKFATPKDNLTSFAVNAASLKPDIVAATAYLFTKDFIVSVIRRIKTLLPECTVILGGPEFLGDNTEFLKKEHSINAVLRGEGEKSFPLWLRTFCKSGVLFRPDMEKWLEIPGLCWMDKNGNCHDNGLATVPTKLIEKFPLPSRSHFFNWSKPFIQIETSRGCPNRCSFCTSPVYGKPGYFSMEYVRKNLEEACGHGIQNIRILDRTFNLPAKRAVKLLKLFIADYSDLKFHLEIHPEFVTGEMHEIFASAPEGMFDLEIGLQSGSTNVHMACSRKFSDKTVWRNLKILCSNKKIHTHIDLLAGLPELDFKSFYRDLTRLSMLKPTEIQIETLKILPGTEIQKNAEKLGLFFAPDPPYEILRTSKMNEFEIETTRKISIIVDLFFNHPELQKAVIHEIERDPDFYIKFIDSDSVKVILEKGNASLERRFETLYKYLKSRNPIAAEILEIGWIISGLSLAKCPGNAQIWKDKIPESAMRIEKVENFDPDKCRIWRLKQSENEFFFVFDRSKNRSKPIAVLRRKT